jgi:mannose-6-phosphate isomerase-like protein (cupin superfamily)
MTAEPLELWCDDLDRAIAVLTGLGMRLDLIMPADAPAVAELSGGDVAVRLRRRAEAPPIEVGRAGMAYRDLLPDRLGGHFIASHITIAEGGPVPDYVHHHDIRFQVIHCVRGWVRLVYEDQGPPFVLEAGDTVLQPPHIRHRVLESSPGLEVLEVSSPAEHPTMVEHEVELPTGAVAPDRDFGGQRFVRHRLADAAWLPWRGPQFEAADTGIGTATDGLAGVRTVRATAAGATSEPARHDGELVLWFVEDGSAVLHLDDEFRPFVRDDAVAVPAGVTFSLADASANLRLVEVTLPGWSADTAGARASPKPKGARVVPIGCR